MVPHARPHLEVHSRSKTHSAIAGVAYRLGLRLYDRRTGIWHDYRKRQVGEEIVRALTIAPPGAPAWASDPHELWSRAEAAEKRKDAAVARDYRIPIPLGLSDTAAGDMAEAMARYLVEQLSVPVSIGVHRDNVVDAVGEAKPEEKIGFHAHLYFPTRSLEQMVGEDGTSEWAFGPKLVLLASKREGSAFVDQLNARWASLANQFTREAGLAADYDHRSYKRMELDLTPQPTLGAAAVAMERKGFFTRRGDALRGDIILPSRLYEAAHAVVLAEQQARAQADVAREAGSHQALDAAVALGEVPPTATPAPLSVCDGASESPAVAMEQAPAFSEPEMPWPPLPEDAPGSLLMRFRAVAPVPETLEAHQALSRVARLVQVIGRILRALSELGDRFRDHEENRGRRMAAKLDTDAQLHEARIRRAAARQQLDRWEAAHPLKMWAAKASGSEDGKPVEWRALHQEAAVLDRRVQEIKGSRRRHQVHLDAFDQEAVVLKQQRAEREGRLAQVVERVRAESLVLADKLMSVVNDEERARIEGAAPQGAPLLHRLVEDASPPKPKPSPTPRMTYPR
ncbi:MobA/MobL family protein [Dyella sp.]|uniref:MobA/MobL family protein n=1 Tax=Dyella sp. TaxID=1869338 RepID=UPI002ECFEEFB